MLLTIAAKIRALLACLLLAAAPAIAQQQINLTTQVRGLLPVSNGGIGIGTLTGLALGNGTSAFSAYGGTSCTNQFPRSLSASGVASCATVANTDLANASTTVAGQTCTLGSTCSIPFASLSTIPTTLSGYGITSPLPVAQGGTAASSAGGTAVDNISGFASTGFLTRTGAGAYSFQSATNGITLGNLAQIGTNTIAGNATSGTANIAALSIGGCSSASSALIWTTNTGFGCNTSITANAVPAANLTGTTLAAGVTASSLTSVGSLSSLTMNGNITLAGNFISRTGSSSLGLNIDASNRAVVSATADSTNFETGQLNLVNSANTALHFDIGVDNTTHTAYFQAHEFGVGYRTLVLQSIGGAVQINGATALPGLATSSGATTGTLCWTTGTGNVNVDTTTTCLLSSAKYKKDEKPLEGGLRKTLALRPVSYMLRDQYNPTGLGEQIGFLAEDVAKVDPRLVSIDSTDGSPHAVRYQQLTAVLTKAIQEQQAQIRRLERRLATLERERPRAIARNAHLVTTH